MTDKELLQLIATKVLRYKVITWQHGKFVCQIPGDKKTFHWNPLEDDGDAFRLFVKLELDVTKTGVWVCVSRDDFAEVCERDVQNCPSVTRRAIVLAAAEIAKSC